MRTALALLLLAAPAWASPPAAPDAKKAPPVKKSEPVKKAEPAKPDAPRLDKHAETRKADAAPSTLTLAPKKKPSRRVLLADWAP